MEEPTVEDNFYITARSHKIWFTPIPGLLERARIVALKEAEDLGLMTEVPEYTFETAGGDTDSQPIDEAVAADPKTSEEDKAKWAQFLADQVVIDVMIFRRRLEMCLKRGIRFDYEPEGEWVGEHRDWLGLEVPDGANERRLHYIETELVGGAEDMAAIYVGVAGAGNIRREEGIQLWERMFRRSEGQPGGDAPPQTDD